MGKYKEFITLLEELVTFGNRAYPKYGNVVILAGGAGSGKGFVIDKLLGIDAKIIDVDSTKELVQRSGGIVSKIHKETGIDISKLDMSNPESVRKLHEILGKNLNIPDRLLSVLAKSINIGAKDRLPNLIFDVTMKDFNKFEKTTELLQGIGYQKENIHIVWVITTKDVALKNNKSRKRVVPEDILIQTHSGAAKTMAMIIDNMGSLKHLMDGDIWFVFNNRDANDVKLDGKTVTSANYAKVKKSGNSGILPLKQEFQDKLTSYTS